MNLLCATGLLYSWINERANTTTQKDLYWNCLEHQKVVLGENESSKYIKVDTTRQTIFFIRIVSNDNHWFLEIATPRYIIINNESVILPMSLVMDLVTMPRGRRSFAYIQYVWIDNHVQLLVSSFEYIIKKKTMNNFAHVWAPMRETIL